MIPKEIKYAAAWVFGVISLPMIGFVGLEFISEFLRYGRTPNEGYVWRLLTLAILFASAACYLLVAAEKQRVDEEKQERF